MGTTITEETTAQSTIAQQDNDEVAHTMSYTISCLAYCSGMGIITQTYCQAQTVAQHRCQGDASFPRHIRRIFHTSRHIVATGHADSYRTDALHATIGCDERCNFLAEHSSEIVDIVVGRYIERVASNNVATHTDNGKGSHIVSDDNTHYFIFYCNTHNAMFLLSFLLFSVIHKMGSMREVLTTRIVSTLSHPMPLRWHQEG